MSPPLPLPPLRGREGWRGGGTNGINKNFYKSEMSEVSCCQGNGNGVKERRVACFELRSGHD